MLRVLMVLLFFSTLMFSDNLHARSTTSTYGRSFHKYLTGTVQSVSSDGIAFEGQNYQYASNMKIKAHEQSKGAFYEVEGRLYEVQVGASVIIKVEGATIYEIIIERWKQ